MNKKIFKDLILKTKKLKKVHYTILFILFTVLTFTLIYNSCSPQGFYTVYSSKVNDKPIPNNEQSNNFPQYRGPSQQNNGPQDGNPFQNVSVEIKNGAPSVSTLQNIPLQLTFTTPEQNSNLQTTNYEMKISQTPDCASGTWETYTANTTRTFTSSKEEEMLSIYVKFKEKGTQEESRCVSDSIFYDNLAPRNLRLSGNPPSKITNQRTATFSFTAEDENPRPLQFYCRITRQGNRPGTWKSCHDGTYDTSRIYIREGEHTFELYARDSAGKNSDVFTYPWTVDYTAPTLSITSCPENSNTMSNSPLSVQSDNLEFPVTVFCQNELGNDQRCGIINRPTSIRILSNHFITERVANNNDYIKRTLTVHAKDEVGNRSHPANCTWYVDTAPPVIQLVEPVPQASYGTNFYNGYPNRHRSPFKIRIDDSSLQSANFQPSDIKTEYKVYYNSALLPTCNDQIESWCSTSDPVKKTTDDNIHYLEQKIDIRRGLEPGLRTGHPHTIKIRAKDAVGNDSEIIEANWDVYGSGINTGIDYLSISDTVKGEVDILFLINDSPSMAEKAIQLGDSFLGIINSLGTLDWQIAVTTMQLHTGFHPYYSYGFPNQSVEQSLDKSPTRHFGKLVRLIDNETNSFLKDGNENYKYILSSKDICTAPFYFGSNDKLKKVFKRTIIDESPNRSTLRNFDFGRIYPGRLGSFFGIHSLNVLLDYDYYLSGQTESSRLRNFNLHLQNQGSRTLAPNNAELKAIKEFVRPKSTLVVILITDTGNCGCIHNPFQCHNEIYNRYTYLIRKVRKVFNRKNKKFVFYPIIPKPGEGDTGGLHSQCRDGYPSVENDSFMRLAQITQGRKGSSGDDKAIRVDFNTNSNRESLISTGGGECPSLNGGAYTQDLCKISKDILKFAKYTFKLQYLPIPIPSDNIGELAPKYHYNPNPITHPTNPNIPPVQPNEFIPLTVERDENGTFIRQVGTQRVSIRIIEPWIGAPHKAIDRRVILEVERGHIPEGTYRVGYPVYATESGREFYGYDEL